MRSRWLCLTVLLLFLGCASERGAAQDGDGKGGDKGGEQRAPKRPAEPSKGEAKGTPQDKESTPAKRDKLDPRDYQATISDRFMKEGEKPFVVAQVRLVVPEVSLFGGSAGKETKTLVVQRGSASIEVPFEKLRGVEVGKVDEDRLEVKVEVESKKPEGRFITGTVKASLELVGIYAGSDLKTTVKLREVLKLSLALQPKAEDEKK
ncbi:MAG: hypothetical protein AB7N76_32980 [Planctomycetota bacterium]